MPVLTAFTSPDTVNGSAGPDQITGSPGADLLLGAGGDDTITAGLVGDTVRGGFGDDSITAASGGLAFGEQGNDTIVGQPDETLNFIEGGVGDDRLDGDPVDRAPFLSYVMYTTATSGVRVSLAETGPQAVGGGAGVDTVLNFNGLIGSAFADTLTAGAGSPQNLLGGAGDDVLIGGPNGAQMQGGAGDDTFQGGGSGRDSVFYDFVPRTDLGLATPTGGLTIDLRISGPQDVGGGVGRDTFISIEGLSGSAFNDTLSGDDAANVFFGQSGADLLRGLGGADTLLGGGENDTLLGGDGDDDLRAFFGNAFMRGEAGNDTLGGLMDQSDLHGNQGADSLAGGERADTIRGGQGDDVILGREGNDWLAGDRGSDTLTGGAGADVFHAWNGAGLDRVTDFSAAAGDRVNLLPGSAPTVSQVGADTVIDFGGGNQMVLVGVTMSTLPAGWIFLA